MCYNEDTNKGERHARPQKEISKNFKKPLDKSLNLWYNKDTPKGEQNQLGRDLPREMENDTMANTNKKMTKADKFNILLNLSEVKSNPTLVEFIEHELELLSKKNSAEKKPTAQQTANEGVKSAIVEVMSAEANRLFTVTEVIKSVPACADLTNQRVSALLRQLMDEGKVERIEEKRKAYFRFAH